MQTDEEISLTMEGGGGGGHCIAALGSFPKILLLVHSCQLMPRGQNKPVFNILIL